MNKIDLHVHSVFSDGTNTPSELVKLAEETQLTAFALTDHDTVAGLEEALEAASHSSVHVIPGVELSAGYLGSEQDVHILGYNMDYKSEAFQAHLDNFQLERVNRNKKMLQNMHDDGIDISYEQVLKAYPDAVITRAHFAWFLIHKGYAKDWSDAFTNFLAKDKPYYVKRELITPMDAVTLIKKAGGIAVLAHPLLYGFNHEQLCILIQKMKNCGLDGIEAMYSLHSEEDEQYVRSLAQDFHLKISGGTDFHGGNKPHIALGRGTTDRPLNIPSTILEELKLM